MKDDNPEPEFLKPQITDYVASATKAIVGIAPFAGSLLAELAGALIPNQRTDRIARFAMVLEDRLSKLEREFVNSQLDNEYFTDLVEEGMRQAARSLSDERRDYIATLIANSLSSAAIEYQESKHLLRILDDLGDIEVVWLRSYAYELMVGDEEFRTKHQEILVPVPAFLGSPQNVLDDATLQQSYKRRLAQLGLLEPRYKVDQKTGRLELREFGGRAELSVSSYQISSLGRLLLREIGQFPETEAD